MRTRVDRGLFGPILEKKVQCLGSLLQLALRILYFQVRHNRAVRVPVDPFVCLCTIKSNLQSMGLGLK